MWRLRWDAREGQPLDTLGGLMQRNLADPRWWCGCCCCQAQQRHNSPGLGPGGRGGMMNSEWVHVVERERGNVWGAGHHSATNSQPRIFLRWPGPGSIHLFICCFGDSKIMELSDTFMIFCIRELIVMSNWINYWILNEWSTFKKCWYLKP